MKKIKVVQIIPSFGVGGAEKVVLDYLTYFNRGNIEMIAISMYENENTIYDKFIESNGIDVVYLNKKSGLDLSISIKIKKIVDEFKPDIIHSHLHSMKYVILSGIRNRNIKLFHTIHSDPKKDAGKIDKIFNKFAFKFLNCTPIALSENLAFDINKFYGVNNSFIIYNGVDIEKFKKIRLSKEEIRKILNIPENSFIIGHIGRFTYTKNHEFIINLFSRFSKINKEAYLILVGDGELKIKIEQKVEYLGLSDKVRFLGLRSDIAEILKAMDVFLFPSHYEGFPITLIEAQASNLRCVVSNGIDKSAILSEDTISVGLEEPIEKWCEVINDFSIKSSFYGDIEDYNIINILNKLEEVYKLT